MKTITIRELHAKTGQLIRLAAQHGEILVTDHGKGVAKIVPHTEENGTPYFSRRKLTPSFRKLAAGGQLRGGKDSTQGISEDREDHALYSLAPKARGHTSLGQPQEKGKSKKSGLKARLIVPMNGQISCAINRAFSAPVKPTLPGALPQAGIGRAFGANLTRLSLVALPPPIKLERISPSLPVDLYANLNLALLGEASLPFSNVVCFLWPCANESR